jgi:hypothetical protein
MLKRKILNVVTGPDQETINDAPQKNEVIGSRSRRDGAPFFSGRAKAITYDLSQRLQDDCLWRLTSDGSLSPSEMVA